MIYSDNSRRAAAEKCMRKRWWAYEYKGRGIEPVRQGRAEWPLVTGSNVHRGIEHLATGGQLDYALGMIRNDYVAETERERYLVGEQLAISEALVRAWHHVSLPKLLANFEVVAVEKELTCLLAPGLTWMSRPDLIVQRRVPPSGDLYILNLKTTKRADERWRAQWPLDAQTLSEVVAAEEHYQRKFSGVIIVGLQKGEQLEYPRGSGQWYHNSPLIWAWHNEMGKPHPLGDWSPVYEWQDEAGTHRLGKGWQKRETWIHYPGGVAAWIDWLAKQRPDILAEQIVELPPILRDERQIESWRCATRVQEHDIRLRRDWVDDVGDDDLWLDEKFPQSTSAGNCLWPTKCPFFAICHENGDPDDSALWRPRTPNHPTEGFDDSTT